MNRAEVNASLPTVDIKGKPYVTVDSRVEAFRQLYPNGSIVTELVHDDGNRCVFKASVHDNDGRRVSTGHAFEVQSASYINKTSYIENCETSAVGRALGFLGIGSNGSIASADEMLGALEQQSRQGKTAPQKAPQGRRDRFANVKRLKAEAIEAGISEDGIKSWMAANVGPDMRTFSDDDILRVEAYIQQLITDKERLNG